MHISGPRQAPLCSPPGPTVAMTTGLCISRAGQRNPLLTLQISPIPPDTSFMLPGMYLQRTPISPPTLSLMCTPAETRQKKARPIYIYMAEPADKTPPVNISVGSLCPDPVSYALKYFSNHGPLTHQQGTVGKVSLGYVNRVCWRCYSCWDRQVE